jgi:NADPH:quinone reductase-like Zn-dependent oxidoreductase
VEDHSKPHSSNASCLAPDEVEIEATAWSVGVRDVLGALGRLELAESFGSDCAGTVTRVGSRCSRFSPGDRVCMFTAPSMRTYPSAPEWAVFAIPDGASDEEACAVMVPALTAWYSLVHVAQLQEGEKVLIHSAAGATGQLALQVARMVGADIFATVGSKEKKDLVIREYGLPESHVLYSRNTSFFQGVMSLTDGYGVDVVLNSTAGDELRASWECIAPYGRFVEIGQANIGANSPLPMGRFANNVSFSAVDVMSFAGRKQKLAKALEQVMALFADGKLHSPRPLHVFPVSDVDGAFRYIQKGESTGRTVIKVDPTTIVQKHLVRRKTWSLSATSTYLVAGGLGGIGRAVLRWLATRGAKHLVVPSRSGAASQAASETVRELEEQGITVFTPVCDVSSTESLAQMLRMCNETMPPIQGCIVATMALNVSHPQYCAYTAFTRPSTAF